jgi:hypothetical protein
MCEEAGEYKAKKKWVKPTITECPQEEWTPETVMAIAKSGFAFEACERISQAHNAALAAAPPNRKADKEWSKLITELAAERERHGRIVEQLVLSCEASDRELAAEREKLYYEKENSKTLRKLLDEERKRIEVLMQELNAAEADAELAKLKESQ